jgi:hypothetical protein
MIAQAISAAASASAFGGLMTLLCVGKAVAVARPHSPQAQTSRHRTMDLLPELLRSAGLTTERTIKGVGVVLAFVLSETAVFRRFY